LLGGDRSAEDIIALVDDGFYVTEVSGIHSGANPVSGELSVGAAGILISGGKLAEPVREVTIAGNLLAILAGIEVVGNDNRWVPFGGSIHAPTLLIEEMTISGK
jgi:PmbA protein